MLFVKLDVLIVFGGGLVIDLVKVFVVEYGDFDCVLCILFGVVGMMGDVLVWFVLLIVVILIMVGIGSEVMWWVIVWDLYNVCKLLLLWFDFFLEMVIVDLCLMVGLLM